MPEASGGAWPKLRLGLLDVVDGSPLHLSATYEHFSEVAKYSAVRFASGAQRLRFRKLSLGPTISEAFDPRFSADGTEFF